MNWTGIHVIISKSADDNKIQKRSKEEEDGNTISAGHQEGGEMGR